MVSKNAGIAFGSKPAVASRPMPTRSASYSFSRVKLICYCAVPCACRDRAHRRVPPAAAPIRMAASTRPRIRGWCVRPCELDAAHVPLRDVRDLVRQHAGQFASLRGSSSRPECTPMKPPGSAKALIAWSLDTKKLNEHAPSWAWARRASPSDCRYSPISGSSSRAAFAPARASPCVRGGTRRRG